MQIGANIIDQWDADNIPTFINFATNELAGIENLPFLNKLVFKPYWDTTVIPNKFDAWLIPSLWNPHQNAAAATGTVRIAVTNGPMTASVASTTSTYQSSGLGAGFLEVAANAFGNPSPPTPQGSGAATDWKDGANQVPATPEGYSGFHFPFSGPTTVTPANTQQAYPDFAFGTDFYMQINVNGGWKPYQKWSGGGPNHPLVCQSPPSWTANNLLDPEFVSIDPRVLRFGIWGNDAHSGIAGDYTSGPTDTLDRTSGYESVTALRPNGTAFAAATSPNLYNYANNSDSTVHYTDPDNLQRRGDANTGGTTAMRPSNSADRPQILNRPFQSVAELGQTSRDQPWKTLDFTTAASGDAGLLDAMTLQDTAMVAGKVSINTRQPIVLKAILSQAAKNLTAGSIISTNERDAIVAALANLTAAQPMLNKGELITRLAADPAVTSLGNKVGRECVMRAFSDAGQTRTWNLMIDLVAQSGRYPPNAGNLAQFVVDGEKRYWLHVAIDRFTGEIVDQQLESVYE